MIDAQTHTAAWLASRSAGRRRGRTMVVLLTLVCVATPSMGGPIPSRAGEAGEADLATVESFLAREEVAQALAATGLSGDEVEQRVAQLSAEDLSSLAANVDQIQSAGGMSTGAWLLVILGVLVIVFAVLVDAGLYRE